MDNTAQEQIVESHRELFGEILEKQHIIASEQTKCKRKGVACTLLEIEDEEFTVYRTFYNGPAFNECSGEKGNCGCAHSEFRAILHILEFDLETPVMLTTYSPCTSCANLILLSGRIDIIGYRILTEHDIRGTELLEKGGIHICQITPTLTKSKGF